MRGKDIWGQKEQRVSVYSVLGLDRSAQTASVITKTGEDLRTVLTKSGLRAEGEWSGERAEVQGQR